MASVLLSELYINDWADPTDFVTTDGFGGLEINDSERGEIHTYAQGRRRSSKRRGSAKVADVTFPTPEWSVVQWLEDHIGRTVMVRDPWSRRFWAIYWAVPVAHRAGPVAPDVTIHLESVTVSEVV
jgi:hypothetical protein